MAHGIGFVDNTGSEGVAHWQMLLTIKTLAEANGWTTLRYLNPTPYTDKTVIRELILQGVGLSGTEQIFIGFRAYQDPAADYYNLTVAAFTGYVAELAFNAQPGCLERGVCAHNNRIDYWLAVNGQRILLGMKVGSPSVYETSYVGKFLPYSAPSQFPYPVVVCGTLASASATRFSDTSSGHTCGARGNANGQLRNLMNAWSGFSVLPWAVGAASRRDTGGYYQGLWAEMYDSGNVWGRFDGLRYVPGFNNASENTMTIDGKLNVMLGDVFRVGIGDFFLLEMN